MSALAAVWLMSIAASAAPSPRYLVAVGHNRGLPSEAMLRFAERDASHFAEVMQAYGSVSADDSVTLFGPTPQAVEAALGRLMAAAADRGQSNAELLFYYSGHADETDLHLGAQRWPRARLERLLAKWPGRLRVAVIDACRGGVGVQDKGFSKVPRFAVEVDGPGGLTGGVTLRSSSVGEASQESEQLEGAIYTHYLLAGLRGAADDDGDQRVTLEEAYLYAYQQTVRRSASGPGNVMHPSVQMDLRGAGALVLTETAERTAMLVLPAESQAVYLVYRRPSGRLVAEVGSTAERPTLIAVPPGDYLVQRRWASAAPGGSGGAREVSIPREARLVLSASEFTSVPMEVLAAKGGRLRIWTHELAVAGGGMLSHAATFGPRARIRYGLVRSEWSVELSVDVGRFEDRDAFNDRVEQWIGGDLRAVRRRWLGPIQLQPRRCVAGHRSAA